MGGVLALISVAACAFTAVTYYRCEKQPEPQLSGNELLHILTVGSAADGVGYEVMRIVGGSMNPPARPALENRFRQDDCRLCGATVNGNFLRLSAVSSTRTNVDVSSYVYVGFVKIRQKAGGNLCRQQKLYNIIII